MLWHSCRLQDSINVAFICTGKQNSLWDALLRYSLYYGESGTEPIIALRSACMQSGSITGHSLLWALFPQWDCRRTQRRAISLSPSLLQTPWLLVYCQGQTWAHKYTCKIELTLTISGVSFTNCVQMFSGCLLAWKFSLKFSSFHQS